MDDPAILPSANIPWFDYSQTNAPVPAPVLVPPPAPAPPAPAPAPTPSPSPAPTPTLPPDIPVPFGAQLASTLLRYQPNISLGHPYPRIIDLSYDVKEYLLFLNALGTMPRFRAVFIVSNLYIVKKELDAYTEEATMDYADYEHLSEHAPQSVIHMEDIEEEEGRSKQARVTICSWVSLLHLI